MELDCIGHSNDLEQILSQTTTVYLSLIYHTIFVVYHRYVVHILEIVILGDKLLGEMNNVSI